jgi:flagellar biosynthesis protein FlhB
MSDKSEAPTPRRLRKAREQGDAPISLALAQSVAFIPALLLMPAVLAAGAGRAGELLVVTLRDGRSPLTTPAVAWEVLRLSLPLLLAVALATALSVMVQTRGMLSTNRVARATRPWSASRSACSIWRWCGARGSAAIA